MENNELSHVGVLGMKWGRRKSHSGSQDKVLKPKYAYIEKEGEFKGERIWQYANPKLELTGKTRKERNKQRIDFVLENMRRTATNELTKDKIRAGSKAVKTVLSIYALYRVSALLAGSKPYTAKDGITGLKNYLADRKLNNFGNFDPRKIINVKP